MASNKPISMMVPKGSWILRLLVVVLIVFVIAAILYPQKLWTKQDEVTELSRERMRNINFIVQRYHDINKAYVDDLDTLLTFIKNDSILIKRPSFEIESLTFYDSKYDSFLIGYVDRFHIEKIEMNRINADSIILSLTPKKLFSDVMPPAQIAMAATDSVKAQWRGKGDEDIYWQVWSRKKVNITELPYDSLVVPSKEYLLTLPVEDIATDPISGQEYLLNLNARMKMVGEINYAVVKRGEPENPIGTNELMINLFVNKLARMARGELDQQMKQDTTLYERQLELQGEFFYNQLSTMGPGKDLTIEAESEKTLPSDSVGNYEDAAIIKDYLFSTSYDSLIRVWTNLPETQEILGKIELSEQYFLSSVDTVGVTIKPPFEKEFQLPSAGFLDKLFNVGPVKFPGYVENDDLSWSEKE